MRLRPATPTDAGFLAAVYASTRMEELAVTGWTESEKAAFCQSQFDAQDAHYRHHYPTAVYQVIEEEDGTPVGRLYVDRWTREIRIMDIALLPSHRDRGIGSHLLTGLQEEASASRRALTIHVERLNPALRLYERLGFRLSEDKGIYLLLEWSPPGERALR